MFSPGAHAFRRGLAAATVLSVLAFAPSALGARSDRSDRERPSGDDRRDVAVERRGEQTSRVEGRSDQPRTERTPAARGERESFRRDPPVQAAPTWQPRGRPAAHESYSPTTRTRPSDVRERPAPVNGQPWQRTETQQPTLERDQRADASRVRPSPYRYYGRSESAESSGQEGRLLRARPARPAETDQPPQGQLARDREQPGATRDVWQPRAVRGGRVDRDVDRERGRSADESGNAVRDRDTDRERSRQQDDTPAESPRERSRANDRRLDVPRPNFRGPEADESVRLIRPNDQERTRAELRERVQAANRRPLDRRTRPTHDAVGNFVPKGMPVLVRDSIARINVSYSRIRGAYGDPSHHYAFIPRSRADYWDGYWDGYADGYWAGRRHRHHHPVVFTFYYPYYWSDPYWFAFWYPGYYPAVYHYWGWCPGWVHPVRTYYVPTEYIYYPPTPYQLYYVGYSVDDIGADRALEDVRRAWFNSEVTPLARHLTDELDIRVYFDGEYVYSTSTDDYYAMTVDAMATTDTVAMDFDRPIWLSTHEFFATGRHVFYDPSGDRQTVFVSYRMRRLGGEWYIVAVGSSLEPIRHKYTDFRY